MGERPTGMTQRLVKGEHARKERAERDVGHDKVLLLHVISPERKRAGEASCRAGRLRRNDEVLATGPGGLETMGRDTLGSRSGPAFGHSATRGIAVRAAEATQESRNTRVAESRSLQQVNQVLTVWNRCLRL